MSATAQPVRTCVGCRKKHAQAKLQRFVYNEGIISVDTSSRQTGRGYYSCSETCLALAKKKGPKRKKGKQA